MLGRADIAKILRYAVSRAAHRQRGSAIIEFVILVPLLIILLVVVVDFGRITAWMQQIAYAADAGAQYAFDTYNELDIRNALTDGNFDVEVANKIEERVRAAVKRGNTPTAIPSLADATVAIDVIWQCRRVEYYSDPKEIRVYLSDEALSAEEVEAELADDFQGCMDKKCQDEENCNRVEPTVSINVAVWTEFEPFTPFMERLFDTGVLNDFATWISTPPDTPPANSPWNSSRRRILPDPE